MTNEEIKELMAIFNESNVAEMEVQRGENRLRLRRAGLAEDMVVAAAVPAVAAAPAPAVAPAVHAASGKPAAPDPNETIVKSPIVGTFYESPAPGSASFVKVGDRVEPGQVLCIIESMKLMNEIEAEVGGVITGKLVENGRPVEYGEALFSIRAR
ncbi:MAG: acetyl-CoA carboxylase biotin carboxyl carrier protein [Bryobacteraceae bacterium]